MRCGLGRLNLLRRASGDNESEIVAPRSSPARQKRDPVEKARLAWLSARYRFEKLLKAEPSEEDYQKAKADLELTKQRNERLADSPLRRRRPQP